MKDFNTYPAIVAKVADLLAEGDYVCVLLGDGVAVATTWDDSDISAIAKKVELDPREDGSFGYLCWTAGGTVVTFEFGGQGLQKGLSKIAVLIGKSRVVFRNR